MLLQLMRDRLRINKSPENFTTRLCVDSSAKISFRLKPPISHIAALYEFRSTLQKSNMRATDLLELSITRTMPFPNAIKHSISRVVDSMVTN